MAKPSIFSRDYEKKMRRRKRRIITSVLLVLLVVVVAFIKFKLPNIDFVEVKAKIQAWVDTGKPQEELEDNEQEIEEEQPEEIVKEPEKTYIDFNIQDGVVAKAEYVEEAGAKRFVALEPIEGYTFTLSPSQQQMIIVDPNQNLYLCNVDGTLKDITKKEYISRSNQSFPKDQMIAANEGYIWHGSPAFIDETKIVYVSQLPYFGASAKDKYVWIKDIVNNTDKTLWKAKGKDIQIGELVPEKGITVTVDGVVKYINADGVISQ